MEFIKQNLTLEKTEKRCPNSLKTLLRFSKAKLSTNIADNKDQNKGETSFYKGNLCFQKGRGATGIGNREIDR